MNPAKFLADRLVAPHARANTALRATDHYGTDWDAMLVLDACRADVFEQSCPPHWRRHLDSRHSAGSATAEWLRRTFADRDAHDTVYVTSNPMYRVERWVGADLSETFHAVVDVWQDAWDDDLGTVTPADVAAAAERAAEQYPDKRLLVHFLQPHTPFIGPVARQSGVGTNTTMERIRDLADGEDTGDRGNIWHDMRDGLVDERTVWVAYSENLREALMEAMPLAEDLRDDRRVVVTSDHGNAFGERVWPFRRRVWGHPHGKWAAGLREVPWVDLPARGERVTVTSGAPEPVGQADADATEERLRALGYVA